MCSLLYPNIPLHEWLDYVKTDKDLVLEESGEAINPITKQKFVMKIAGRALFDNSEILYKNGCIGCDDYSKKMLDKLKQIAAFFDAEVFD